MNIKQVSFQLGRLYHQLEQLDIAQEHYLNSVQIALAVGEQTLALSALQQLELVALLSKRYANALRYFDQGRQILSGINEES